MLTKIKKRINSEAEKAGYKLLYTPGVDEDIYTVIDTKTAMLSSMFTISLINDSIRVIRDNIKSTSLDTWFETIVSNVITEDTMDKVYPAINKVDYTKAMFLSPFLYVITIKRTESCNATISLELKRNKYGPTRDLGVVGTLSDDNEVFDYIMYNKVPNAVVELEGEFNESVRALASHVNHIFNTRAKQNELKDIGDLDLTGRLIPLVQKDK